MKYKSPWECFLHFFLLQDFDLSGSYRLESEVIDVQGKTYIKLWKQTEDLSANQIF